MQQAFRRLAFFLAGLATLLTLAGCSSAGSTRFSYHEQATPVANRAYTLHTNDQLHVQVYNEQTITGDYTVDSTGYLSIPVAGRVKAAGLTVEQLERRVTGQLNGSILIDARVIIQIATYAPFYIRGEVIKPGEFPYKPGVTIADAVALAGGYTYRADESKAFVRSAGAGTEISRPLNVDPPISPGDNIRVPERFF